MESSQEILKVSLLEEGILKLVLHRPQALNALNTELLEKIHYVLEGAKTDNAVKVIVITGEGKAFCAGADINQLAMLNGQDGARFARHGQNIFRTLEQLGKPSVAAINGFALGGGCELAMAATIRIAASNAAFGQPEIKLGVIPGFGGTQRLARLVGKGRALDLCLTGRMIKADEALTWGLVTHVVAPEVLQEQAHQIAKGLAQVAPLALKSMMTVIDYGYDMPLEQAFELEAAHFGLCCASRDKHEGVAAFLEKRPAIFVGE